MNIRENKQTPSHYAKSAIVDKMDISDISQSQHSNISHLSHISHLSQMEEKKKLKFMSSKNVNNGGGKSTLIGAGEMMLFDFKEVRK